MKAASAHGGADSDTRLKTTGGPGEENRRNSPVREGRNARDGPRRLTDGRPEVRLLTSPFAHDHDHRTIWLSNEPPKRTTFFCTRSCFFSSYGETKTETSAPIGETQFSAKFVLNEK